jgi:tRNA (mo5U34)-methyltransferase
MSAEDARAAIASRALWYHTMELAPGEETPGWFDLRPIVDRMPWPDVRGKRCLDVGPWDGFLSFELERRGASEVVATDIAHPRDWDWPVLMRERGPAAMEAIAGDDPGGGFRIAKRLLGSSVERTEMSVYDLTPERLGTFDVVVCGSLMLHLKDPVRALEAIRSVCKGEFLSAEQLSGGLTLLTRRRPLARLRGGDRGQWWIPNAAAHRSMVVAAGFEIERTSRPYCIPLGPGHPTRGRYRGSLRQHAFTLALTGHTGVLHAALLARPAAAEPAGEVASS